MSRTALLPTLALAAVAVLAGGCTGGSVAPQSATSSAAPTPSPTPVTTSAAASAPASPSPSAHATASTTPSAGAVIRSLPDSQWAAIVAAGAWHAGCPASQLTLRRVEVGYHGFDGNVHRGVLVVNADVAVSVARIFTRLFDRGFPIHKMVPIEAYGGDDNASMAADNTSAYNCRRSSQANAPSTASPHANGRAIDMNPYENPWVDVRCHCFQPDAFYGTHRTGKGVITKGGVAWTVFTSAGWIWQDSSSTDFQHFDTGYPSRPR